MSRLMVNILRANPGLLALSLLVAIGTLVLSFFVYAIWRSDGSFRPVVFFGVFGAIILVPNLIGQLVTAVRPAVGSSSAQASAFDDLSAVFGTPVPSPLQDAKAIFPDLFGAATRAHLYVYPTGAMTTVAQFAGKQDAMDAAGAYIRGFGATDLKGDERTGWRGRRERANDFVEMYRTDRELLIWTAPTERELAEQRKTSDRAVAAIAPPPPVPLFPALSPLAAIMRPTWMKVGGIALLVLIASTWFFKGSAWASRVNPPPGATPRPASFVRDRLLAIDALDTPMAVRVSDDGRQIDVTWKYADAKWIDVARAHGLKRTQRLRLTLDESDHTVRVIEQSSAHDWSAAASDASFKWETSRGITFYEYRHERVAGLQFTPDGKPTPNLTYAYTFDFHELKQPIIGAVTQAGWTWQPTLFDGPRALRWLTE